MTHFIFLVKFFAQFFAIKEKPLRFFDYLEDPVSEYLLQSA